MKCRHVGVRDIVRGSEVSLAGISDTVSSDKGDIPCIWQSVGDMDYFKHVIFEIWRVTFEHNSGVKQILQSVLVWSIPSPVRYNYFSSAEKHKGKMTHVWEMFLVSKCKRFTPTLNIILETCYDYVLPSLLWPSWLWLQSINMAITNDSHRSHLHSVGPILVMWKTQSLCSQLSTLSTAIAIIHDCAVRLFHMSRTGPTHWRCSLSLVNAWLLGLLKVFELCDVSVK